MHRKLMIAALLALILLPLSAKITIVSSSSSQLTLSYEITDYEIGDISTENGNYKKIFANGNGSMKAGVPDLPTAAAWIAIPRGTQASLTAYSNGFEIENVSDLAPVPQPAPEVKDAGVPQLVIDKEIYGRNQLYPEKLAGLEKESDYRGQPCAVVRFYPFQYNPVSGELQIHKNLRVEISFNGAAEALPANMNSANLADYISAIAVNGEEVVAYENSLSNVRETYRDLGSDMLIFCPAEFMEPALELKAWKERKGISTEVISTSISGNTPFSIAAYIADYCENSDPAPQYIMLFGDAEYIPPWYVHIDSYSGFMMATDIYYADLEMEFDFLLDFAFGRLPVDTVEDAQRMVENIINYEQNPPEAASFYQSVAIAGAFQDGASGNPPDTYANRRFAKTSEDIRNYLNQEDYAPQRLYHEYNGYSGSSLYPTYWNQNYFIFENDTPGAELDLEIQKPQFSWDYSDFDVSNALNSGSFLLSHRDHGGRGGWGEPDYNRNDVDQLANGELLPVVWSVNCLTGYFDNETDEPGQGTGDEDECFVEHWFRNPNGGAIGAVASTRVSYSGNNDRLVWGLMNAIWPGFLEWCEAEYPVHNPIYRMGDVINYAKTYLVTNSEIDDTMLITYEEFEWFGDPTLEIWTAQPQEMMVSHEPQIEYGNSEFNVDAGITGAVCTLWNGETVIGEAASGLDNVAHIVYSSFDYMNELLLTVTYQQMLPYTSIIPVTSPQAGFLELQTLILDDNAGNMNGMADYGETIDIGMQLHNIGNEAVTDFNLTLTSESEYISINNATYDFIGTIASLETLELEQMFQINIAADCPDTENVVLQFSADDFNFAQNIILHAPQLSSGYFTIDDEDANNNSAADPGETVIVNLPVCNIGSAIATDVVVMLLSYDPYITIEPAQITIAELGNEPVILQFTGIVSESAPLGTDYELQAFLNSTAYSFDRLMTGNYGFTIEDFESGDFSLFDWQISGTVGWQIDTDAASGNYSARTELMGVNNWTEMAVSGFLPEDSVIGFSRKLYADTSLPDNNGGMLYFLIDEEEIDAWGANRPWQFMQYDVPSGTHTFRWIFEKDTDPTLGYDGAWIDRIEFPNMSPPPPPHLLIDVDEINMTLGVGNEAETSFILSNAGAGIVDYYIYFQEETRNLADSRLTLSTYQYYPSQTTGWLLRLKNNADDSEAIMDLDVSFPQEVTVNVATPLTGCSAGVLVPDGTLGSGVTVNWHGETETGTGFILPGETAQGAVNVTIAEAALLSFTLDAVITGDQGSVIEQQLHLGNLSNGWLTLSGNNGALVYGQLEEINLYFSTENLEAGNYQQELLLIDTYGNESIITVNLEVVSSDANDADVAMVTGLSSIYPNPFNPETTISFNLNQKENVNISVYNLKGQKMATLMDTEMSEGKHQLIWNADNYVSGIYFIKLKTKSVNDIQRTLLLK